MTGWSWETVDEMLLEQANALNAYWARFPPMHELAAAYLGISGDRPAESSSTRPEITEADRRRLAELTQKWGLA